MAIKKTQFNYFVNEFYFIRKMIKKKAEQVIRSNKKKSAKLYDMNHR